MWVIPSLVNAHISNCIGNVPQILPFSKFHSNSFSCFEVVLQTSYRSSNQQREITQKVLKVKQVSCALHFLSMPTVLSFIKLSCYGEDGQTDALFTICLPKGHKNCYKRLKSG